MPDILKNRSCLVTPITLAAIKAFGLQSTQYEPQILRDMFQQRFNVRKMGQKAFDKLNCGYTLIGTDLYTRSIQVFLSCNCVMANRRIDDNIVSYNSLRDIAWGIWQYCNLVGQLDDHKPTQQFNSDIIVYIRQLARAHGVTKLPPWMQFAQPVVSYPQQLSSDPVVFQAYMQRQQSQRNSLIQFVVNKQNMLLSQLQQLHIQKI